MAKTSTSIKATAKKKGTSKTKKTNNSGATAEMKILMTLALLDAIGLTEVDRKFVMQLSGIKNEGSFKTTCGIMKRNGNASFPSGTTMKITEAGMAKLGSSAPAKATTNEQVQAIIHDEFIKGKKPREIFNFLVDGHPHSIAEIAKAIDVDETNASLKTYITSVGKFTDKVDGPNGTKLIQLKDLAFNKSGRLE